MERLTGVTGFTGIGNHEPGYSLHDMNRGSGVHLPFIIENLSQLNRNAVDWLNNGGYGYNPPVSRRLEKPGEIVERILVSLPPKII